MANREQQEELIAKYLYECDDGILRAVIVRWENTIVSDKRPYHERAYHILDLIPDEGEIRKAVGAELQVWMNNYGSGVVDFVDRLMAATTLLKKGKSLKEEK